MDTKQLHVKALLSTTNGTKLANAFADYWLNIWTPEDPNISWDSCISYCKTFLVSKEMAPVTFLTEEWVDAIKRTKKHTAAGIDGWTLQDFL